MLIFVLIFKILSTRENMLEIIQVKNDTPETWLENIVHLRMLIRLHLIRYQTKTLEK